MKIAACMRGSDIIKVLRDGSFRWGGENGSPPPNTRILKQLLVSFFQTNLGTDPGKTRRRPEEEAATAAGRSPGKLD